MHRWICWCDSGHNGTLNEPFEKCPKCEKEIYLISAKCEAGVHNECLDPRICICPCVVEANEPEYDPTVIVCPINNYSSLGEFLSNEVWTSVAIHEYTDFVAMYQKMGKEIRFIGKITKIARPMEFANILGVRRMAKDERDKKRAIVVLHGTIERLERGILFGNDIIRRFRYATLSKLWNASNTDDLWG